MKNFSKYLEFILKCEVSAYFYFKKKANLWLFYPATLHVIARKAAEFSLDLVLKQ